MTQAVAGKGRAVIAGIVPPGNAALAQQLPERLWPGEKQGAQQMAAIVAGRHAAQRGPARAARKAQQHVLAQIPVMMAESHKIRPTRAALLFQKSVASVASGFFQAPAVAGRQPGYIRVALYARYAELCAKVTRAAGIRIGFGPQAVIYGQREKIEPETRRKNIQDAGQSGGISPARKRQHQPGAARDLQTAQTEAFHHETQPGGGWGQAAQFRQRVHEQMKVNR